MKKLLLLLLLACSSITVSYSQEMLDQHFNKSWRILRQNRDMAFSVAAEELSSSWGNWDMRNFGQIPRISSGEIDLGFNRNNLVIWRDCYSNLGESLQLFKDQNPSDVDYNRNMAYIHYVTGYTYGILASLFDQAYIYDFENMLPDYSLKPFQNLLEVSVGHFESAKDFAEVGDFVLPTNWINGNDISDEDFIKIINTHAARFIMNSSRGNDDVDWEKVIELLGNGIEEDLSILGDGGTVWWSRTLIQGHMSLWARVSQRVINMMANESTKDIGGVYPYPDGVTTLPPVVSNDKRFEDFFEYNPAIQFVADRGYYYFSNYRFKRYDEFIVSFSSRMPEIDLIEKELMIAEAFLNVGRTGEALVIINKSRENGELSSLESSISDDELFSFLQYEKTLASFGHGVAYFDKRRWGTLYPDTFKNLPIPSEIEGSTSLEVSKPFNGVKNFPIDGSIEVSFYNQFNGMPTHQSDFSSIEVDAVISEGQVVSFTVPLSATSTTFGDALSQSFKLGDYINLSSEQEYSLNISRTDPTDLSVVKVDGFQLQMTDFNALDRWSSNTLEDPLAEEDSELLRSFEDAARILNIYSDFITEFNKATNEWRVLASSITTQFNPFYIDLNRQPLSNPAVGYGNDILYIPAITALKDVNSNRISRTQIDEILFFDFSSNNWVVRANENGAQPLSNCYSCAHGNAQGVFYTYLNGDDNKIVIKKITPGGSPIEIIYEDTPVEFFPSNPEMIFAKNGRVFLGGDRALVKIEFDANYEEVENVTDLHQVFISQLEADGLGSENLRELSLAGSFAAGRGPVSAYSSDGNELYMSYATNGDIRPTHFYFDGVNWQLLFNKEIEYTGGLDRWYGGGANTFVTADLITGSNIHWFSNGEQLAMGKLAPGKVNRLFGERLIFQDENFNFSDFLPEAEELDITGELKVGENLNAIYTYTDIDGDTETGTAFEWIRASATDGTGETVINGATTQALLLSDDDLGMFIKVRITPGNVNGQGQTEDSEYVGPIKKDQVISFDALPNKTYGEAPFNLAATSDAGTEVSFESSNPSIVSISGETATIHASGNVDIIAKQAGENFYNEAEEVGRSLIIEKAMLSTTAEDKSRTYGTDNPEFTISYSGFVNGDDVSDITSPSASTAADATSDVGGYDITLSGGSSTNYSINTTDGMLTINQATLTATAEDKSKTYGDDNPELTISYSGFLNGDDVSDITSPSASTAADATSDVGGYDITLSGGSSTNYSINTTDGMLTINQATLTATAEDKSKTYGADNPELTISYSGFLNGDDVSDITAPSASTAADVTSDVGGYDITLSGGSSTNYNMNVTNGTLTINQATLTATAEDKSKTYGDDNPELTISYLGFVNGEDEGAITEPTVSTNADKSTEVGTLPITLSGGSSGNYSLITNSGLLTINPASLTATAQDEAINKGDDLPTFIISYQGFVNEEDESVLTTAPTASTTATTSSDRGTYPINVSDGTADNYSIITVAATLTVTGPVYNLPTAITFDILALGDSDTQDINIDNTGDGELNVSAIALPAGYAVNQNTLNVAEGTNGSITITFNPTAAQIYSGDITISSNNGEEIILVNGEGQIVTSIDDEQLDVEEVKVFPNPSSDWIIIDLRGSPAKEANLSLVNAQGIPAWRQNKVTENEVRVDVSTFSSGLYLLMVETSKGTVIKKVMVKH